MTRVVNIRLEPHWKNHPDYVYIGRGSKWGNRYLIGWNGTREEVIVKYHKWILTQPDLMTHLWELKDKILGCYCKPKACHGDILVGLIEDPLTYIST